MKIYEIDIALEGLDWGRDEELDDLMEGYGGFREGSGSDGRTRDLIYSFETELEAKRARTALKFDELSMDVVELGEVRAIEVES